MPLPFPYTVKYSARRTLAVQITPDAAVLVRAPLRTKNERIERFLSEHVAWIEKNLLKMREKRTKYPEPTACEIEELRRRAEEHIPPRVALYAEKMGLSPSGVRITAARRRFGSCSPKNSLCFSLFLMRYPDAAIDYVVVHELAHIRHRNHGSDFYREIAHILPDYRARERLLRD